MVEVDGWWRANDQVRYRRLRPRPLRSLRLAPPQRTAGEVELRLHVGGCGARAGAPLPDPPPQTARGRENYRARWRDRAGSSRPPPPDPLPRSAGGGGELRVLRRNRLSEGGAARTSSVHRTMAPAEESTRPSLGAGRVATALGRAFRAGGLRAFPAANSFARRGGHAGPESRPTSGAASKSTKWARYGSPWRHTAPTPPPVRIPSSGIRRPHGTDPSVRPLRGGAAAGGAG